jgi:hypothetical protein
MISPSYDFSQFATSVKGKPYDDVICDAQQELLSVWRRVVRVDNIHEAERELIQAYQKNLKDFITFLRYSVDTVSNKNENSRFFLEVKELMPKKDTTY